MTERSPRLTRELSASTGGWEMALAPLLVGLVGYAVDRALGTTPIFTIVLALATLGCVVFRIVVTYQADMSKIEADAVWNRVPSDVADVAVDSEVAQ